MPGLCLIIGLVLLPVGCGERAPAAEPTQQPPTTSVPPTTAPVGPEVAWDPCTLPDAALAETGLDPETATDSLGDVTLTVQACVWTADPPRYSVLVLSLTNSPYDRSRSERAENGPVPTVHLDSRRAFEDTGTENGGCGIVVEMPYEGRAKFILSPLSPVDQVEACTLVRRHVEDLEQYLPPV